jgi:hypothetical protein
MKRALKALVVVGFAVSGLAIGVAASSATGLSKPSVTICSGWIFSPLTGDVVVPPGDSYTIVGTVVAGNFTVSEGASGSLNATEVTGNVNVKDGGSLYAAYGITITGNLTAHGATALTVYKDVAIGGDVQITDSGGMQLWNNAVRGDVRIADSAGVNYLGNSVQGSVKITGTDAVTFTGDTVNGDLICHGNTTVTFYDAPVVLGKALGQCAPPYVLAP